MATTKRAAVTAPRPPRRGLRRRLHTWLRDWRRGRAKSRRPRQRGAVYLLAFTLLLLFGAFAWALNYLGPRIDGRELTLDELESLIAQRRIVSARFLDEDAQLRGRFRPLPSGVPGVSVGPASSDFGRFTVRYPKSDAVTGRLNDLLLRAGSTVEVDQQETKARVRLVTTFLLPLMILANLFMLLFTLSRSGGGSAIGEVMTFGSIGAKKRKRNQARPVTFADIAGADEAVAELREVRDYLADPERYDEIGAMPPKGVLLFGPPGCGKTLLAKAVAGEAGVPFFSVAGAEFVESLVGVGAARVRDLFSRVRAVAPAIVFIDELDAAGRKRGTGGSAGGSDEREQTLNQLLVEMDGFDVSSGIVVMAATNRPDIIDPALLRPGRFDRHITVDQPDVAGRESILRLHARGRRVAPEVDFGLVARRTPGFTGADLANVVNEAALLAVREGRAAIGVREMEEAVQRVLAGPQRRGRVLGADERRRAARHEAGHAIVAGAVGRADSVHRVSIVARGKLLGTAGLSDGDEALLTLSQLHGRLVTALAGVAAEELVFGEPSTGAENDLELATELARDMVARYGMSRRLGRMRLMGKASDAFLDGAVPVGPVSAMSLQALDAEVRGLLAEAEAEATRLLHRHHAAFDELSARLEQRETVEGEELVDLLAAVAAAATAPDDVEQPAVTAAPEVVEEPAVAAASRVEEPARSRRPRVRRTVPSAGDTQVAGPVTEPAPELAADLPAAD